MKGGEKKLDLRDTFQLCKMGKTVWSGSASLWVSADVSRNQGSSLACAPCQPVLEPGTFSGLDPDAPHTPQKH